MARVPIGTRVAVGSLQGVVLGHRPQGMVDFQPAGEDFVMRQREADLIRLNPEPTAVRLFLLIRPVLVRALRRKKMRYLNLPQAERVTFVQGQALNAGISPLLALRSRKVAAEVERMFTPWLEDGGDEVGLAALDMAAEVTALQANPKRKKTKKAPSRRSEVHRQHIEKTPKSGAQGTKKGKKGYTRKTKHRRRNPAGSRPLAVRAEVLSMLNDPPAAWAALFRRLSIPPQLSLEELIDQVRGSTPSGRSAEKHYNLTMGEGAHVPPKAVREAALLGLRLSYEHNYTSPSGVGLIRAIQLVLEPSVDNLTVTRMAAYLSRHARDKEAAHFGDLDRPSRGYMAWLNWGGDPAVEWLSS